MILSKPGNHCFTEFLGEFNQFVSVRLRGHTGTVVFCNVSFAAAGIEVFGVSFPFLAKNHREGLERAIMLQSFFGPKPRSMEQNCAQFQRGVVSDPKTPICRNVTVGILQVSFHDGEKILDFLGRTLMGSQPSITLPLFQAQFPFP